nr:dna repair protein rhp7 [Quercus suber]
MASDERKPTPGQLSSNLPGPTTYLTGHNASTGKAIIHSARPVNWKEYDNKNYAMSVAYTTAFPADLNGDADVEAHEAKMKSQLGLVSGGGTVLRYVDLAPAYTCMMHRTQSVDYGIVLEGQVVSVLDSGEEQLMSRGDVMVQRATMHAWKNPSSTEWSRMLFVLQDCKPLYINGERFGEDLGTASGGDIPPSGNDNHVLSCRSFTFMQALYAIPDYLPPRSICRYLVILNILHFKTRITLLIIFSSHRPRSASEYSPKSSFACLEIMSGRRNGNRIRGPQSALTDFLASQNISAAQIRDDYERRQREAAQQVNAGEGPSNAAAEQEEADEAIAAAEQAEEEKSRKRKRSQKETIDKIKKSRKKDIKKGKKKGKKGEDDDDSNDNYDEDLARDMYRKSRPAPGQFEHCEICSKRFTVTPYSKEGPDGGLLCTPCGKAQTKDLKSEKKAVAKPAGRRRRKLESDRLDGIAVGGAKSLIQLCIQKVAKHHEDIEELGDLPGPLVEKLSEIFSKKRVMKSKALPLFLRPDLDSIVIPDAAYLEEEDYQQMFAVMPNIRKLALSNCCQLKDASVEYMLEKCHELRHVQLYAANLVTTEMWHRFFEQIGSRLEVLKLNWLDAAFEDHSVQEMVKHCKNIERLKLKLCRRIGEDAVTALSELPNLKHLSLHIGREVSNQALQALIKSRGANLRTLSLEKFLDADNSVLQAIHDDCRQLSKLRFSENDTANDAGFAALFTDWLNPSLTYIDMNSTRDVDNNNPNGPEEAIGLGSSGFRALMSHSGPTLRHLDISSCRHIELVAFLDAFDGSYTYPALEYINVSFCNRVDTTVVAGVFQSCPALKQLVAFGCFDVQDVVVPRNIALIGVPRAQDAIEQHGVGIGVDEAVGRMVEAAA